MTNQIFEQSVILPVSAEEAYAWHSRPGAFERVAPPWEGIRVVERQGEFEHARVVLDVPLLGPIRQRWVAQHRDHIPGRQFVDQQVSGPFAHWVHHHLFEPVGDSQSKMTDSIVYALPISAMASLGQGFVRQKLARVFRYRQAVTRDDLAAHSRFSSQPKLHVAITGATGLIGRSLEAFLTTGGHRVTRIVRRNTRPGDLTWDPPTGRIDAAGLEGVDAVVHLAGETISQRWTAEHKRRVRESREQGTRLIAQTLAGLARPPKVLVSASAVGIYGDGGDRLLTEADGPSLKDSPSVAYGPTESFLVQVSRLWERAAAPATEAGIRTVNLRIGLVLTPAGGALQKLLPPFLLGLGGPLGSGRQYMSWISLDDLIGALHHALFTPSLVGPVNATGPSPVTNAEFTATLGHVVRRPTVVPVPAVALRLLLGEMAEGLLLTGARVIPERLSATGYPFRHQTLEAALRHVLGR